MDVPLLILDLDETLVFSRERRPDESWDFETGEYVTSTRPHLDTFLETVFGWFRVAVWTSSGEAYAHEIVHKVFPDPSQLVFVWTSARCTRRYDPENRQFYSVKDLRKVRRAGHRLERVLMIDDSPEKLERHYGNHLRLHPFEGDLADRELVEVLPYLDWIRHQPDFRTIEKRTWRLGRPSNDESAEGSSG